MAREDAYGSTYASTSLKVGSYLPLRTLRAVRYAHSVSCSLPAMSSTAIAYGATHALGQVRY
eukprot:2511194-Rhodomonas_salina.2